MNTLRSLLAAASLAALAACGGGATSSSGSQPFSPSGSFCDPGTSVQLARPASGTNGVSTNTTQIEIVASDKNNQLFNSYTSFQVLLVDQFNRTYSGGALTLTSDNTGPHPYASDFYYNSAFPNGLPGGLGFTAYLNVPNSNCNPVALGTFST